MQIRPEQVDALAQRSENEFETRLAAFLREQFPDAREEPVERLRPEIQGQIRQARSYGLETERQIANYVTSAWMLGPDFDREIEIMQRVLSNPIHTPENKSEWLIRKACELLKSLEDGPPS